MLKAILKSLMLAALIIGFFGVDVNAQRQPTAGETEVYRNFPCSDPWINFAYAVEFKRLPVGSGNNVGECNIKLYRDGNWNNYLELREAVISTGSELGGKLKLAKMNDGNFAVIFTEPGFAEKVGIVGTNSGHIISDKNPSSLIGKDGASFQNINFSNNPANLISDKGTGFTNVANVINGNGSTLQVVESSKAYGVQSAGAKKVITLKNGAKIIIR